MEREIGNLSRGCRSMNMIEKESSGNRAEVFEKYLGKEKYTYQMANAEDEVGDRPVVWHGPV